jgi:predicted DNA-binding transcriptional regulator AlpA
MLSIQTSEPMTQGAGSPDTALATSGSAPRVAAEATALALSNLAAMGAAIAAQVRPPAEGMQLTPPGAPPSEGASIPAWSPTDLLTVGEAAAALRISPRWLYRHAKTLPFTRKLSRKVLRFSRSGITRWLATKRP